jgi:methionyl-tRNA formyltransferase
MTKARGTFAFLGSKQFGLAVLTRLHEMSPSRLKCVFTVSDEPDPRSAFGSISAFCERAGIPLTTASEPDDISTILERHGVDFLFVCGWYRLLPERLLARLAGGAMGIHHSLLPRYKGGAPLVWAIINGETEVGSSLFLFSGAMDAGDLFLQVRTPLSSQDTIATVSSRLEAMMIEELSKAWPDILSGRHAPTPQNFSDSTFCAQRTSDDGAIDWTKPAGMLYNFIRAQSAPYPGAFTYLWGKKLTIRSATVFGYPCFGPPGQVVLIEGHRPVIACGEDTALILNDVVLDGATENIVGQINSVRLRCSSTDRV